MHKMYNFIKRTMFWIKVKTLYRKYYRCKHFCANCTYYGWCVFDYYNKLCPKKHANNLKGYSHKDCTLYVSNTLAPAKR